jgi:hypothetical protein
VLAAVPPASNLPPIAELMPTGAVVAAGAAASTGVSNESVGSVLGDELAMRLIIHVTDV